MIDIDDTLNERLRRQMDGLYNDDEVTRFRNIAKSYAVCENSIAVLCNLRTDTSYIYFGKTSDILGFEPSGSFQEVGSIWEEEIFRRIHPADLQRRDREELAFYHIVSTAHSDKSFAWHMEQTVRMSDSKGKYMPVLHRVFYFQGAGQRGISYALCLYNLTTKASRVARLLNTLTGEERQLDVDEHQLLTEREKTVLSMVRKGLSSKAISEQLAISKHTVDRHRQNIISKLHSANMAEACHKAKELGLVE